MMALVMVSQRMIERVRSTSRALHYVGVSPQISKLLCRDSLRDPDGGWIEPSDGKEQKTNTVTDIFLAESLKHICKELPAKRGIFGVNGCAQSDSISELIKSSA